MTPQLTLPDTAILLRLGAAILAGCAIGLNRELLGKPAGIRTHGLVSLGAALVILTSLGIAGPDASSVLRTVQGIMGGIGFLGGGVILRDNSQHSVHGLTTAATIWVAACLGIACGAGQWIVAVTAAGLTLLLLIAGERLERLIRRRFARSPAQPEPFTSPPPAGE
jgi:putative Mg2+ transporter-C (MgtC) family protein